MESSSIALCVRTVARLRNISAAAEELGVTQPALSARIKKLESQLGAPIFDRTKSPLVITEVGRAYLECQDGIEALNRDLARKITAMENLEAGRLVVGGASFFNITYLPKAVAAFTERYPGIDIRIVDDTVPNLTEMAVNGQLDLFITPSESSNSGLEYDEFLTEKIFLCLPPNAPEVALLPAVGADGYARIDEDDFKVLADIPFIMLGSTQQIGRKMAELLKRYKLMPRKTVMVDQTMTSLGLTLAGVGASLITETTLQSGNLKQLPAMYLADEEICTRSLYVAQPKSEMSSRAAEAFIEILREVN